MFGSSLQIQPLSGNIYNMGRMVETTQLHYMISTIMEIPILPLMKIIMGSCGSSQNYQPFCIALTY